MSSRTPSSTATLSPPRRKLCSSSRNDLWINLPRRSHKTLRGPRAGLIFFRKDSEKAADLEKRVNDAVFPACQGGPHNNTIAGIATALLQATQPTWKEYAKQVIANAQTLGAELVARGYKLQTSGTDNHLVLWDLRPLGLTGSKLEKLCDLVGITINSAQLSSPPMRTR